MTILDYEYGRYTKEIRDMTKRVKQEYEDKYNKIKAKSKDSSLTEARHMSRRKDSFKMSTNFAKEFKLYESLFSDHKYKSNRHNKLAENIQGDDSEDGLYTDLLYVNDMDDLLDYANSYWAGMYTLDNLRALLDDEDIEMSDFVRGMLEETVNTVEAVRLRDAKIEDTDAYLRIT